MFFAFNIFTNKIPELNLFELGECYLSDFARSENLIIADVPIKRPFVSAYVESNNQNYILLNKSLRGVRRLYFAWYEIGHYLVHAPRHFTNYWKWLGWQKEKFEAESLSLMAMMPKRQFLFIENEQRRAICPFIRALLKRRRYLMEHWKL